MTAAGAADSGGTAELGEAHWIGAVLGGRYRVTRLIGSGGMGVVYEARHELIDRSFAVKLLHPALGRRKNMNERFEREARACGALAHEHIAAVVDFGTAEGGTPYLVMEYLEGCDLATLVGECGPLSVPRATDIVRQACFGLRVAHERGVVHRDLKPENLFVCRGDDGRDRIKILDFGIAKLLGDSGPSPKRLTRTGTTLGTPYYMSPEQARGDKDIDSRSDIYALGVILYELLSGAVPHPGDSYNEVIYGILNKPAAPLERRRPGLPTSLYQLVAAAMARARGDRVPSASALADALRPFAEVPSLGEIEAETPSHIGTTRVEALTNSTLRERTPDRSGDRESAPPVRAKSSRRTPAPASGAALGEHETTLPATLPRRLSVWLWLTAPLLFAAALLSLTAGEQDATTAPAEAASGAPAPSAEAVPPQESGSQSSAEGTPVRIEAVQASASAAASPNADGQERAGSPVRSPSGGMQREAPARPNPSGEAAARPTAAGGSESMAPKADEAAAAARGEQPVTYDRDNPYGR